ncbi:hypothetical protein [Niveibacterium sp. COAC-50]|uniref:hypothetical protein n=1 Tax=Niveibacterium sp. COAC-50 TaxID=2729384 RepID=UPI001557D4C7|nr:hypothetical protein [Niveibacterium sp. COAC-50]
MANEQKPEEIVKIYRDSSDKERILVEVLGEPIVALKQMKAEPWLLKDRKDQAEPK